MPVAVGLAILRYRLFDIDLLIARTVVYGLLSAGFTVIYLAIVVGVGTLVGSARQAERVAVGGRHRRDRGGLPTRA